MAELSKRLFCTTDYINVAQRILDTHGIVVITGKPGSGKTWCALHLLGRQGDRIPVILSERSDWLTLPLEKNLKKGYIILIDDIFGKQTFFKDRSDSWQHIYHQIGYHVKKNNVHVIMTSKSHIFHRYYSATSDISLYGPDRRANLDDLQMAKTERNEMICKYDERRKLGKRLDSKEREKAAELTPDVGFPFCCHLYKEDENLGLDFFLSPVEAIFWTLTELYDNDRKMYHLLVLIMMKNGCITPSIMEPKDICDLRLATDELPDLCRSLKGTFLKDNVSPATSTKYRFISEFHMKSLFLHYIRKQTKVCIMKAPLSLVLQLITLEGKSNQQYVLKTDEHIFLCERLVSEISDDTVNEILDHSCFRQHDCIKILVKLIISNKEKWKLKEQHQMYVLFSSAEMFNKVKTLGDNKDYAKVISVPFEMREQTEIQLFSYDHIFCWLIMKDHKEAALEFYRTCNKDEICKAAASALSCVVFMGNVEVYTEMKDSGFVVSPENLKALTASSSNVPIIEDDILINKIIAAVLDEALHEVLLISVHLNHIKQMEMFVQEICQRKVKSDIFERVLMHKLLQLSMQKTTNCLFVGNANLYQGKIVEYLRSEGVKIDIPTCLFLASCQDDDIILKQFVETSRIIKDRNGVSPLHLASQYGSTRTVSALLDVGYDVNLMNENKDTPLHYAVVDNGEEIINMLIKSGADVNKSNQDGCTPFHTACASGNIDAVDLLLKIIPDVNIQSNKGRTGLHHIADNNIPNSKSETVIKLMVKYNVDIDRKDELGETPLFKSVSHCKISTLEHLLNCGADPNARDNEEKSALHACSKVTNRQDLFVQVLLKYGADPLLLDNSGMTALEHISNSESSDKKNGCKAIKMLVKDGESKMGSKHKSLLHKAITENKLDFARTLLQNGASVNIQDAYGCSPLHEAILSANSAFIPLLLEYGADKCIQNNSGYSAIQICAAASLYNDTNALKMLRPLIIGINIPSNEGRTPLHYAAVSLETNVVQFLLEEGADPNIKDINGETPLHRMLSRTENKAALHVKPTYFKEGGHPNNEPEIVVMMLNKGADQNIQNNKGETLLHVLLRKMNFQETVSSASKNSLQELLAQNNDVNVALNKQNQYGQSPLHLITKPELCQLLREAQRMCQT